MKKAIWFALPALMAGAAFALTACGGTNGEKKTRSLDTRIERVYQTGDGMLCVELSDFVHEDLAQAGREKTAMQVSLDGGAHWGDFDVGEVLYSQTGRGIYSVMGTTDGSDFTFYTTGTGGSISYRAGDALSVAIRIPASETYAESAASEPVSYTLKAASSMEGLFANHFGAFLKKKSDYDSLTPVDFESNGYVLYYEAGGVRAGKSSRRSRGSNISRSSPRGRI